MKSRPDWRVVALIATVGACTDPLENSFLPTGTYPLIAVEGSQLPFRGPTAITVRGALALGSGASYILTQTDSAITGGALTQLRSEGSWSLNDNAIVLHEGSGNPIYLGVVSPVDTSIRVGFDGHMNTYDRR
jgi:hypothetical protein